MKKVSVIVPIYNGELYLKESLQTLLDQTYTNLEIICVNDGSQDNSGKIIDDLAAFDSRIIALHQRNSGPSIARNLALEICSGDYITFMDSDDYIEKNYIEELVKGIEENHADMCICGHDVIYPQMIMQIHATHSSLLSRKTAIKHLLKDSIIKNYAWGKCFKKELWEGIRFPIHRYYEDIETIYKPMLKAKKIFLSDKILYHYMIRSGSITQENLVERSEEMKIALNNQLEGITQVYPEFKLASIRHNIYIHVYTQFSKLREFLSNKKS